MNFTHKMLQMYFFVAFLLFLNLLFPVEITAQFSSPNIADTPISFGFNANPDSNQSTFVNTNLDTDTFELLPNEIIVWAFPVQNEYSNTTANKAKASQNLATLKSTFKTRFPFSTSTLATTKTVELWELPPNTDQATFNALLTELNQQSGIQAFQNYRIKKKPTQPEPISDASLSTFSQKNGAQNILTTNDSFFSLQYALKNNGDFNGNSTPDADIDGVEAWNLNTGSANNAVVIFDSGIDIDHPDLVKNLWVNPNEIADNNIDDDGNGFTDDIHGWNTANNNNKVNDTDGHGTHVAGIVGAEANNGIGVAGINHEVKLIALKVFRNNGFAYASDMIEGYEYITKLLQAGVNIVAINQSLGGDANQTEALKAQNRLFVDYARTHAAYNAVWVVSAGNSNHNHDTNSFFKTPANYQAENIITVGSSDYFDEKSDFSDFGNHTIELSAPGTRIASAYKDGQYVYLNGSSMAAPQVSGVIALAAALYPNESASAKVARILATADPIAALNGSTLSSKRLNAFNALNTANQNTQSPSIAVNPAKGYFKTIDEYASFSTGFVNTTASPIMVNSAQITGTNAAQFSIRSSDSYGSLAVGATFGFAIEVTQGPISPIYTAQLVVNTSTGTINIPIEVGFQSIPQTTLSLSGSFTAADKTYNRNRNATLQTNNLTLQGLNSGDQVSLTDVVLNFNNRNVGARTVSIESASITGADAGKYVLSLVGAPTTNATILPKELSLAGSFSVNNKSFDGSTAASLLNNNLQLNGVLGSDEVNLVNVEVNFSDPNPALAIPVEITSATLTGAQSANYELNLENAPTSTAAILASTLSLSGSFSVANKSYDGTESAVITANNLTLLGLSTGDQVSIDSLNVIFLSATAAAGKTVIIDHISLAGSDANKYTLSLINAPTSTATIFPDTLTVTGSFTAADKVYDGSLQATVATSSLSLETPINNDSVHINAVYASFSQINVGTALPVQIDSMQLAGKDASNYVLPLSANLPISQASIKAAAISIVGFFSVEDKIYNRSPNFQIKEQNLALVGIKNNDDIQLDSLVIEANQHSVGSDIPVYISNARLVGVQASNYELNLSDTPTASAKITKAPLLIEGFFHVNDKQYDGTTTAETVLDSSALSLVGIIAPDSVEITQIEAEFISNSASDSAKVILQSVSLSGSSAANYEIVNTTAITSTAIIKKADLTITAINDTLTYSGIPYSGGNGVYFSGFIGSEDANVLLDTLVYTGSAQGAIKMGSYTIIPGGLTSNNYALHFKPGVLEITADSLLLSSHFPAKNQTKVALNPVIQLNFDQEITVKDTQNILIFTEGKSPLQIASFTSNSTRVVLQLKDSLAYETTYQVQIASGIVEAASGRENDPYEWAFTTMKSAPVFLGMQLSEDRLISVDNDIVLAFNQSLNNNTIDQDAVWVQQVGSEERLYPISVTIGDTASIKIVFGTQLAMNQNYTLFIAANFVQNLEGTANIAAQQHFKTYLQPPFTALTATDFVISYEDENNRKKTTVYWPKIPHTKRYQLQETSRSIKQNDNIALITNTPLDTVLTDTSFVFPAETLSAANSYSFQLRGINDGGVGPWSAEFQLSGTLTVDVFDTNLDAQLPVVFELFQNYPNPFNPNTTIRYALPQTVTSVSLEIYNNLGQLIKVQNLGTQAAGTYSINIQMGNEPTGIYYYRLQAGMEFVQTRSMTLVK